MLFVRALYRSGDAFRFIKISFSKLKAAEIDAGELTCNSVLLARFLNIYVCHFPGVHSTVHKLVDVEKRRVLRVSVSHSKKSMACCRRSH